MASHPTSGLRVDPEYLKAVAPFLSKLAMHASATPNKQPDIATLRVFIATLFAGAFKDYQDHSKAIEFVSHDGAKLVMYRHDPKKASADAGKPAEAAPAAEQETPATPTPAVLFIHGGGQVSSSAQMYSPLVAARAQATGVPFFAVEYRLAPENPAPCGVEDCFAALKHLSAHAAELGVDPARIAVMGDSGGGCLSAGTALLARDRKLSPPLEMQVLVYPQLDDRTTLADDDPVHKFLLWSLAANRTSWGALLGDRAGKADADVPVYAAPARAKDLSGLPPTYIDCGSLDLFRGESTAYAARLAEAHVEVELHIWPGVPHAFDVLAPSIAVTKMAEAARLLALKKL